MVQWITRWLRWGVLFTLVLLTGCLQYDLELQFDSQTHGQWVQHLRWQGSAIAPQPAADPWLQVLVSRAEAVGGQLQEVGETAIDIVLPFNNAQDLEHKFNQFFSPTTTDFPLTLPGGEPIGAELSIRQGNWWVALHTHLTLRVDLTAVPDLAQTHLPLLQTARLLTGQVTLVTPWGARSPDQPKTASIQRWSLKAGEVNTLEADFWLPSPIGIGAIAIAALVALGYGLKYGWPRRSPGPHQT